MFTNMEVGTKIIGEFIIALALTVIIGGVSIFNLGGLGEEVHQLATMDIVVDAVSEVLNINEDDIEPTSAFNTTVDTACIIDMAKMKGDIKILLDIDKVLSIQEIKSLNQAV